MRAVRWFKHVQRRDSGYIAQNMLKIELPGEKKMKKPQRKHGYPEEGYAEGWCDRRGC